MEGFDNGMPQVFHADIVDAGNSRLLSNVTSPIPYFVVNGLRAGQTVRIFVYASNRKGPSERIILETQTIKEAERITGKWLVYLVKGHTQVETRERRNARSAFASPSVNLLAALRTNLAKTQAF